MITELKCVYDARNSFYGKAKVESVRSSIEQVKDLYSYNTLVARVITDFKTCKTKYELIPYKINGKTKTQTTTRHIKEFLKQNNLTESEIEELFKNGILEV